MPASLLPVSGHTQTYAALAASQPFPELLLIYCKIISLAFLSRRAKERLIKSLRKTLNPTIVMIKNLQRKMLSGLRRTVLVGLISTLCVATTALAEDTNATTMKPVVVTGSLIPTAETVGPAPVNTITTVDIQRAGQQDILSTLTRLDPSFSGSFNLGQVANNFTVYTTPIESAGEANVAIRNLPSLVLLDGRRLGNSALSAGQAVDLNTIPISIVDRVEVLKDGASALYGSDAIGGVVNVITKRNWNGTEIGGRVGFPTRKDSNDILERRASIITGATGDSYSFFAGAQYYYMDPLLAKDRHTASASITDLLNAKDDKGNVGIAPPSYFSPSFPGRVQDSTGSYILAGSPFAVGTSVAPYHFVAINTPPIITGGPFGGRTGVQDYNNAAFAQLGYYPYIPMADTPLGMQVNNALIAAGQEGLIGLYPTLNTTLFGVHSIQTQDRRNFFANFDHDLFDKHLQFFGSFLFANNHSEGQLAPSPVPSLTGSAIFVPSTNIFNPFGVDLGAGGAGTPRVRYRFVETANRTFDAQSDVYHFIGGLKGEITPKYDWEAAYNYNRSEQTDFTRNAINGEQLNRALAGTATDPSGNPLGGFNIFSLPGYNTTNSPETVKSLKTTLFQSGVSELWSVDGHVHGEPFELPAGPFNIVLGGTYTYEDISFDVDGLTQLGLVPGLNAAFPFGGGKRDRYAGFAEAKIPVFSENWNIPGFYSFEITAAGRHEVIEPGGDSTVPKVGVRWQPIDKSLTIRGGYTEGFIAPSIFSLFGPDTISDPVIALGSGGGGQVQTQTRSNPNLPPSESEQWGVGFVYSPKFIPGLTVSVDYYNIQQNKVIIADYVAAAKSLNALGLQFPAESRNAESDRK